MGIRNSGPKPALTQFFESAPQVLTPAGQLSIAHGLATTPKLVQLSIKCLTAEYGYAVGDEVIIAFHDSNTASHNGMSAWYGSSNVNIQFGTTGVAMIIRRNASVGNLVQIIPANWSLIVRAWA